MQEYILPVILITLSGFIFLQNKKPITERAIAFNDPWGPIIYIPTSLTGVILLLRMGFLEAIMGWFAGIFLGGIINSVFEEIINKPEGDSGGEQSGLFVSLPKKTEGVSASSADLVITIPPPFREKFPTKDIIITRNIDGCLLVFEKEEWKKFLERLKALHSTKTLSRYSLRFMELMISARVETRISEDWKIIIPDYLREYAKLDNSAVLIDIGRALEIWNKEELKRLRARDAKELE